MKSIVFFDAEINPENGQILDIGAVDSDGRHFMLLPWASSLHLSRNTAISAVTISLPLT